MGTLTEARHAHILDRLSEDRGVKAAIIAGELGVSTETIRRDLLQLESEGRLKRVYGGAIPLGRDIPPLYVRMADNPTGKDAIARVAARMVERDQWVYVSGGSTLIPVAEALADRPRISAMTHMPAIADALIGRAGHEIHLTGGRYDPQHRILRGDAVFDSIDNRLFDLAIIGAHGLNAELGIVDVVEFLSRLKRKLMTRARHCIWICDVTGFGLEAHFRTAPLDAMTTLITDERPPDALGNALADAGVELLAAHEILAIEAT